MGMQKHIKLNVGTSEELWPYQVMDVVEEVMEAGQAKHPDEDWDKVPVADHIEHAINCLVNYTPEKGDEDHLAHAFARIMMAVAIERGYTNA